MPIGLSETNTIGYVAISAEIRKARGEDYSTLKGFFKQYTLIYVVADERDVIRLRTTQRLQFIDARITKPGSFGHSYFHANPAVSSDLILYLRYHLPPGGKDGRPLGIEDNGFWAMDDRYPGSIDALWFQAI